MKQNEMGVQGESNSGGFKKKEKIIRFTEASSRNGDEREIEFRREIRFRIKNKVGIEVHPCIPLT